MSDLYPTPLAAAQMYAVMGWRVAPVQPGSKVPSVKEWQTVATTDQAQISKWWSQFDSGQSATGVCIVTGRETGLWVLDVDVADGKRGLETLRALVAENGPLGETLVARTPSGGYHYFFAYPDDVEIHNSASNRLGAGLDVRGEGGQVNAAPTKRGDAAYRWADGRAPWSAEVQPAPAWLVELVKDAPRRVENIVPQVWLDAHPDAAAEIASLPTHSPQVARTISASLHELDGVPTFVTDYNARTNWPELLTSGGWEPCQTRGDIDYWTRPGKSCREGISASTNYAGSDLLYVWSTSIAGLPSDRAYDRYGYMVHRDFGGDFDAAARHFVAERRQDSAVGERIQPADLLPKSESLLGQETSQPEETGDDADPSKFESALMRLDLPAFWDNDPTAKDWLIEPFLANSRAHALYASAKAGKSYIALQAIAAACVPGHESWATTPAELIRVLYLDYEMTEDDLRERLTIFGYGADDDYSNLHYVKASLLGADLDTKDGGRELTDQALAWGVQLVVVDTMSRAVSGDENDADTVRKFYQHTGRLLKAHGIAWLRIDHAGKDGDKGQRGSSAKNDDVDVVWRLERLDAGARLTRTHSRVFWIDEEILLRNVAHPDGGVTHERTANADEVQGITAKAREWLRLGIPLTVSRDALRDEWEFQFDTNAFGALKRRVQTLAEEAGYATKPLPSGGPSFLFPKTDGQTE